MQKPFFIDYPRLLHWEMTTQLDEYSMKEKYQKLGKKTSGILQDLKNLPTVLYPTNSNTQKSTMMEESSFLSLMMTSFSMPFKDVLLAKQKSKKGTSVLSLTMTFPVSGDL